MSSASDWGPVSNWINLPGKKVVLPNKPGFAADGSFLELRLSRTKKCKPDMHRPPLATENQAVGHFS